MKVKDLDGEFYSWTMDGNKVSSALKKSRSKLQEKAKDLILELFPVATIIEEVPVRIRRGRTLYFDFYISNINCVIEVQGEQHYKFSTFYHNSMQDFINQKIKDGEKFEWCELNDITYIELPYNEEKEWRKIIINRHQKND